MVTQYTATLRSSAGAPTLYGPNGSEWSTSGSTNENTTTNWRVHIQNVEIMYRRTTAYKVLDGTADFNYLDVHYVIEASREHIWLNSSAGDMIQYQTLDLISDSSSGALGLSGVIRTELAGVIRREVRAGDVEVNNRMTGNCIVGKQPGAYNSSYDTSGNTNSTVLDMLIKAKTYCPQFEINLVDL